MVGNSRPSSTDSSHSNSNAAIVAGIAAAAGGAGQNVSFSDVMLEYAKLSQDERINEAIRAAVAAATGNNVTGSGGGGEGRSPVRQAFDMKSHSGKIPVGYPEVTLHPVSAMFDSGCNSNNNNNNNNNSNASGGAHTNSLLHGILTKVNFILAKEIPLKN